MEISSNEIVKDSKKFMNKILQSSPIVEQILKES